MNVPLTVFTSKDKLFAWEPRRPVTEGTCYRGDLLPRGPTAEGTYSRGDLLPRGPVTEGTYNQGDL